MSNSVWISKAPADSTLADGFMASDLTGGDNERLIALSKAGRHGEPVEADALPKEAWGEVGPYRAHHFPGYWPEITYYSGIWIVSGKVAAILGDFDLGDGTLAPVRRFERDHVSPVPGEWFCWNIGNKKSGLLGAQSSNVVPVGPDKWLPLDVKDHDLKYSAAAAAGADAWFDPQLHDMLFLSGPLGRALIDAGLANEKAGFGQLIECDVVEA